MTSEEHYDTISIGSGEAGRTICWDRSSSLGAKCAVIEHKWLAGSCPNMACLPSKNYIHAAEIVYGNQKYAGTGLLKGGDGAVDIGAVRERKRDMVRGLREMFEGIFKDTKVEVIWGHGRFIGPKKVEVELQEGGKRILTADHIVICTGSRAKIDDTAGLKESKPLTHIEILELGEVPQHLLILGGGYVGMEFAQVFRRFGSTVTVIDRNARVLKREDEDVTDSLVNALKDEGIEFLTSTTISKVTGTSGQSVTLVGSQDGKPMEVTGTHLLVAGGRVPNTEDVGLGVAGIDQTPAGHVKVNEHLQTNIPGVSAGGDCAGQPHFTHMGFDDFRIIRDDWLQKKIPRSTKNRQVPYTLFTIPELAHVGLNESDAQKAGIEYRLTKIPMAASLRTRTMDATYGFAKALISKTDDKILGFTALGPSTGEMLPLVSLTMAEGLPYTVISELIVVHPTLNEGLVALFSSVPSLN